MTRVIVIMLLITMLLPSSLASAAKNKNPKPEKKTIEIAEGSSVTLKINNIRKKDISKVTARSENKKVARVKVQDKRTLLIKGKSAGKTKVNVTVTCKTEVAGKKKWKLSVKVKVSPEQTPGEEPTDVPGEPEEPTPTPDPTPGGDPTPTPTPIPIPSPLPRPTTTPGPSPSTGPTTTPPAETGSLLVYADSMDTAHFLGSVTEELGTAFAPTPAPDPNAPDISGGIAKNDGCNNPVVFTRLTSEPGVMEYNGRLYLYGSNDSESYEYKQWLPLGYYYNNNVSGSVNCYSTADMVNWTDHGTIAVAGRSSSGGPASWATNAGEPMAVHTYIDGREKFFLYFSDGGTSIGVLSSDSPTGPFRDVKGSALITRSTEGTDEVSFLWDPSVCLNAAGTAYIIFGGGKTNGKACIAQLDSNMIQLAEQCRPLSLPYVAGGSDLIKIGDKYYYSYVVSMPANNTNVGAFTMSFNDIFMLTDAAIGPWDSSFIKYRIATHEDLQPVDIDPALFNNHCITKFKDRYYMFWQRQWKDPNCENCPRLFGSIYCTELTYDPDTGSLTGTSFGEEGVSMIGTVNPYETVQAETMARGKGITVSGSGDTKVSGKSEGSFVAIQGVDFGDEGASRFTLKLGDDSYSFDLVSPLTGVHDIYFKFDRADLNFDSWICE